MKLGFCHYLLFLFVFVSSSLSIDVEVDGSFTPSAAYTPNGVPLNIYGKNNNNINDILVSVSSGVFITANV